MKNEIASSIDEIEIFNSNPCGSNLVTSIKSSRSKSRKMSLTENHDLMPSSASLLCKYSSLNEHLCEMDKLFKGLSVTSTQCLACENLRNSPEVFYDRTLPVNTTTNGKY